MAIASCAVVACAQWFDIDDNVCETGRTCELDAGTPDAGQKDASVDASMMDSSARHGDIHDDDPGMTADAAVDDPLCEDYCQRITDKCDLNDDQDNRQYADLAECRRMCPALHQAWDSARGNNTLECRLSYLTDPTLEPSTECEAAGRGGGGDVACGTKCESYCLMMRRVCPAWYGVIYAAEFDTCVASCNALQPPPRPFSADQKPNDDPVRPNVNCLLWHVGKAAEREIEEGNIHCAHAVGRDPCGPLPTDALPRPNFGDAGDR
jgi:hypothetical protein